MKYCYECGSELTLGTERFCPNCGQKVTPRVEEGITNIGNTSGDVIGTDVKGKINVFGKEFAYTREGHAIVINIMNHPSQEETRGINGCTTN